MVLPKTPRQRPTLSVALTSQRFPRWVNRRPDLSIGSWLTRACREFTRAGVLLAPGSTFKVAIR